MEENLPLEHPLESVLSYHGNLDGERVQREPSLNEERFVREQYEKYPVRGHYIYSITVLDNPILIQAFKVQVAKLNKRRAIGAFKASWMNDPMDTPDGRLLRKRHNDLVEQLSNPYKHYKYPEVKFLPLWHGTKPDYVSSILDTGYANLAITDAGYFGKGIYGSVEAEYSHRVYSSGGVLILNWVVHYSAYPVIAKDDLQGKGNYGNYDAHFIPVIPMNLGNPYEATYNACKTTADVPVYREMVSFESFSFLPRFLVILKQDHIGRALADDKNSTALELYQTAIDLRKKNQHDACVAYLSKAANMNLALAYHELGWCFRKGHGVPKDLNQAFAYFSKASDMRLGISLIELAFCYKKGEGTKQDHETAVKFFEMAAQTGSAVAYYELAWHSIKGNGCLLDPVKGFKYFKFSANAGLVRGQYQVALCYRDGIGVEKNLTKALNYFNKASENGHEEAKINAKKYISNVTTKTTTTINYSKWTFSR
jgi:hypothetical protein